MVILLPYFEDIYCKDFPGETFRVLKEKEGCAVEGQGCKYASNWRALHEVVFEALGLTAPTDKVKEGDSIWTK